MEVRDEKKIGRLVTDLFFHDAETQLSYEDTAFSFFASWDINHAGTDHEYILFLSHRPDSYHSDLQ